MGAGNEEAPTSAGARGPLAAALGRSLRHGHVRTHLIIPNSDHFGQLCYFFTRVVGGSRQNASVSLVRSKQRVADHGEVFTPPELVEAMIGLVRQEAERIDSRFLEPACGSGNFLVPVLLHKLQAVQQRYAQSDFEMRHHALLALMSIYGIELLADNVTECRANLVRAFDEFAPSETGDDTWHRAASRVVRLNIVHGDALLMRTKGSDNEPISFSEWAYLGKGRFHRRDFRFDTLTQMSTFGEEDTLFADLGQHEIFIPTVDHGTVTVSDLAGGHHG